MSQDTPPDRHEFFVVLFTQHEGDLRAFTRSLLPAWNDVDEVMQRTALALWRKFDQFDPGTQFMKWACVVARFEVLAYRRKMARDRLVFSEDLMELLAEQTAETESLAAVRREERALESCLERLPANHRELVTLAYTPGVQISEVAAQQGRKPGEFYMRLNRIRKTLLECVEQQLQRDEPA